jgi:hypothetical protein
MILPPGLLANLVSFLFARIKPPLIPTDKPKIQTLVGNLLSIGQTICPMSSTEPQIPGPTGAAAKPNRLRTAPVGAGGQLSAYLVTDYVVFPVLWCWTARQRPDLAGGPRVRVFFLLPVLLNLVCGSLGCKSPSQYISPRVVGRVLDGRTHAPIQDVEVSKAGANASYRPMEPPKGAQLLQQPSPARTGEGGEFVLESARALAFFRRIGWYSVNVLFQHPGYEPFATNFTLAEVTNTTAGEPVVIAGDILLTPLTK